MKKILLILFFLTSSSAFAQNVPEISTDRPDQSESPDVVPLKHTQFEAGFSFERLEPTPQNSLYKYSLDIYATPDLLVRYGLNNGMELRFGTSLTTSTSAVEISGLGKFSGSETDFGPIMIGGKFKLGEEGEFFPATSLLFEAEMPALTIKNSSSYFNPSVKLCFSNAMSSTADLSYNLGINIDNENSTVVTGLYTLSVGLSLTDRIGMYGEIYGFLPFERNSESSHYLDAGFTYLVKNNLQLDLSGGYGLQKNITDYYIAAGVSFRIPN